jgi:hypothetical protein
MSLAGRRSAEEIAVEGGAAIAHEEAAPAPMPQFTWITDANSQYGNRFHVRILGALML